MYNGIWETTQICIHNKPQHLWVQDGVEWYRWPWISSLLHFFHQTTMSCASSTPLLRQLGNASSIFQIQRHVTWHVYHFPTLPCSDWTDHTKAAIYPLNQNELEWIDPVLSSRLLFIVAGELRVWWSEGHPHCPRRSATPWQSTKSIFHHSCHKEEDEFDAHGKVSIQLFWKDKLNGLAAV